MLLKKQLLFISALLACMGVAAQDFENEHVFETSTQLGVDAWKLAPSTNDNTYLLNQNLYLANSQSKWDYTSVSPWIKLISNAKLSNDLSFTLKFRADQSLGMRIDDLHFDWSFWPTTGVRLGVVDFKVNWCKTYDLDSAWVRQNDPFCVSPITFTSNNAGPGVQLYNNLRLGDYNIQTIGGVYRPTLFKYNHKEFGNTYLAETDTATKNNKLGLAASVLNTETGTLFRAGYLKTDQSASITKQTQFLNQNVDFLFYGIEFLLSNSTSIELHHIDSNWTTQQYDNGVIYNFVSYPPELSYLIDSRRNATALEIKNQFDSRNIIAYAYSRYIYNVDSATSYTYIQHVTPVPSTATAQLLNFVGTSHSIAWRRDLGDGWFYSLQYTRAFTNRKNPEGSASGTAYGLRLAYQF